MSNETEKLATSSNVVIQLCECYDEADDYGIIETVLCENCAQCECCRLYDGHIMPYSWVLFGQPFPGEVFVGDCPIHEELADEYGIMRSDVRIIFRRL